MPTVKWRRAYIRLSRLDKRFWLKEKFQQVKRRLRPRAPGVEVIELEDEVAEVEVLEEEVEVLEDEEEVIVEEEELVVELEGVAVTEAVEEKVEVVKQSKVRKRQYNQPFEVSLDLENEEKEDEVEMIVQSTVRKKKYDQAFSKHPVVEEEEDKEVIFQPRESRQRQDRSGKGKVKRCRGPEIVTLEEDDTEEEVEYVEEVERGRRRVGAREQGLWAREARFQPRVNLLGLLNTIVRRQGLEDRLGGWQEISQEEITIEEDHITIDEDSWTGGLLAQEEETTVEEDDEDDILLMALPPDSSQLGLNQWSQPHVRDLTGEMERAAGDGRGRTRWRQQDKEEVNVMDFLAIDIVEEAHGQDVEVVEVEEDSSLVQETNEDKKDEKDLEEENQEEEMMEESRVESSGARPSGKRSRRELKPRYRAGA